VRIANTNRNSQFYADGNGHGYRNRYTYARAVR
jgi:hypothetical protein